MKKSEATFGDLKRFFLLPMSLCGSGLSVSWLGFKLVVNTTTKEKILPGSSPVTDAPDGGSRAPEWNFLLPFYIRLMRSAP